MGSTVGVRTMCTPCTPCSTREPCSPSRNQGHISSRKAGCGGANLQTNLVNNRDSTGKKDSQRAYGTTSPSGFCSVFFLLPYVRCTAAVN